LACGESAADTALSAALRYLPAAMEVRMVKTALDNFSRPPCAELLGWRLLDARPQEGWIKLAFEGKPEFCNPAGFIQGGILAAMLDDTRGRRRSSGLRASSTPRPSA
jgi:hypothetical protein